MEIIASRTLHRNRLLRIAVFGGLGLLNTVFAGSSSETVPVISKKSEKPAWLTDLSLGAKEGYDSNLYGGGWNATSNRTMENSSSWVTTISPKIGVSLVPLFGDQKVIQTFTLAYLADYSIYTNDSTETNYAHRFAGALKGKYQDVTFSLENTFAFIDGSHVGPSYPSNYRSSFATAMPRERRNQDQDRSKVFFQYDHGAWFVRPIMSVLYYNLNTELKNPSVATTAYQNYVDRYDINGGLDLGYKFYPGVAATIGYRYGYQYQQQFSWNGTGGDHNTAPFSVSNNYNRLLFGAEGKIQKWLTFQFQMGPDFRSYEANSKTHISPVNQLNPVVFYGDAIVTADVTSKDKLVFLFKDWRWVSSTGMVAYQDSAYNLTYTRKLTNQLTATLQTIAANSNYNCDQGTNGIRNDWLFTVSPGLRYAFNSHVSANIAYTANWGVNGFDGSLPSNAPSASRQFFENVISVGGVVAF